MFKRIVCFFLPFCVTATAVAQTDSFETKNVVLKEVLIQSGQGGRGTLQRQQGNVQKSTEKILESISGVTLIRRGNFAMEPTLRGLNAGQIALTIDGMAMFGACTDRMDPISSYIEPNNLQSIEINYGANEAYNGNAIGGGFNFKIKQPRVSAVKTWSGMAGVGYQTNGNAVETMASVNYSTPRLGVLANGIFRESGNYRAGGGDEIRFSQYSKWNGGLGVKYQLKEKSYLLMNYIQDEGYNIGYPALTMDVDYAKAKIGSLAYLVHSDGDALRHLEGKIYFNTIDHAMDDTKRPKEEVFMHMDMPGKSFTAGAIGDAEWQFKRHEVKSRISLYQNRLRAEMTMYPETGVPMFMLTLPDAQRTVANLQLSDKYAVTRKLFLTAGIGGNFVSSDIYSQEGLKMVSGVFGSDVKNETFLLNAYLQPHLQLNSDFSVFVNLAFNSRAATLQELYGFYLFNRADGYDYIGNPRLKNEVSLNTVAGFQVRKTKFKADGQLYHYAIRNYITGLKMDGYSVMTHGAHGVKQYGNIARANMMGMEANVSYELLKDLMISSKNSYSYGKDADGDALPLIPPFRSVEQIRYHLKDSHLSLEGVIASAQKRVNFEKYGETQTPSYFLMNFSAGHDFKWDSKKVSATVAVENVFDGRYYGHLDILKVPQPGRNLTMRLIMSF